MEENRHFKAGKSATARVTPPGPLQQSSQPQECCTVEQLKGLWIPFQEHLDISLVKIKHVWSSSKCTILNKVQQPLHPLELAIQNTMFPFKWDMKSHRHIVATTDTASRGFRCPSTPPKMTTDFAHTYVRTTAVTIQQDTHLVFYNVKMKNSAGIRTHKMGTCRVREG